VLHESQTLKDEEEKIIPVIKELLKKAHFTWADPTVPKFPGPKPQHAKLRAYWANSCIVI
jgi:hypothetical protein